MSHNSHYQSGITVVVNRSGKGFNLAVFHKEVHMRGIFKKYFVQSPGAVQAILQGWAIF